MSSQTLWHHVIRWRAIVLITLVFISSNQQMTTINISANSKVQVHLFYCIFNLSVIKVTRSTKVSRGERMSFFYLFIFFTCTKSMMKFFRTACFSEILVMESTKLSWGISIVHHLPASGVPGDKYRSKKKCIMEGFFESWIDNPCSLDPRGMLSSFLGILKYISRHYLQGRNV